MKLAESVLSRLNENKDKLIKGRVRYYDAKRMLGDVVGQDGVSYEIALNPSDKKDQAWGKKIKKGSQIKFKRVDDPDFDMAVIGDFSFT